MQTYLKSLIFVSVVSFFSVYWGMPLVEMEYASKTSTSTITAPFNENYPIFSTGEDTSFTDTTVRTRILTSLQRTLPTAAAQADPAKTACEATNALLAQTLNQLKDRDAQLDTERKKNEELARQRNRAGKTFLLVNIVAAFFVYVFKQVVEIIEDTKVKRFFNMLSLLVPLVQAIVIWALST